MNNVLLHRKAIQRNYRANFAAIKPVRGILILLALIGVVTLMFHDARAQSDSDGVVYVVNIHGEIDLGLAPYLERVLNDAADANADAVLIDIDTPGGRLDAVLQMQNAILGSEVQTVAFVDRTAFSAGALVAISCEVIYMAPGSVMGAATPIDGATGETASEKVISAVTATFESTAEDRGRDPQIAGAMVDPDIEIPGLVDSGQLLTLTVSQALANGYSEGEIATQEDVLNTLGLADAQVIDTSPSFAERLVQFLTSPVVSSVLVLGGIFLIIGDLFTAGIGFGALFGLILLGIFFYGHMLAGLAGWEDFLLILLGVGLIAAEVFVIPGFGIAGIGGLIAILAGVYLSLTNRDVRTPGVNDRAYLSLGIIAAGLLLGFVAIVWFLPRSARFSHLVLSANVGGDAVSPNATTQVSEFNWRKKLGLHAVEPSVEEFAPDEELALPRYGVAENDLRPSGIGIFDGERVDVVTSGEYINGGSEIELVKDEGYRRVVKAVSKAPAHPEATEI